MRIWRETLKVAAFAAVTLVLSGCARCRGCDLGRNAAEPEGALEPEITERAPEREPTAGPRRDDTAAPVSAAIVARAGDEIAAAVHSPPEVAPFHIIGRADRRDPAGPRLGWPGTQLRARFTGPSLTLDLADSATSLYDVTVDGVRATMLVVSGPRKTYLVAADASASPGAVHDVVITKRTETFVGTTQLLGLAPGAGGALIPTLVPSGRRMEIIGDSISCGFGVLGADETCPFTAETESEPEAWGALAAEQLGAIHTSIAVSGIGLYRNYGGETEGTMPEVYGRSIANDPSSTWDHSFVPDVIVLSLATNDFVGKGDPGPGFRDAGVTFLARLRARHPSAWIVMTTSPMLSDANRTALRAHLEAMLAARAAEGDAKMSLLEIDEQSTADGLGCGYHPSRATHRKMAATLAAHVRTVMGW